MNQPKQTQMLGIRIDDQLEQRLQRVAQWAGTTKTQLARRLILERIEEIERRGQIVFAPSQPQTPNPVQK